MNNQKYSELNQFMNDYKNNALDMASYKLLNLFLVTKVAYHFEIILYYEFKLYFTK
jgi:hypothetical protein